MTLLIDGDLLVYRCGFAAEKKRYVVNVSPSAKVHVATHKEALAMARNIEGATIEHELVVEPVENALHNVSTIMGKILEGSTNYELYLTGSGNFRHDVATIQKYKGNRSPFAKPRHYDAIRSFIVNRWNGVIVEGQEADDEIGIRAYELKKQGKDYVIVTIDKDLDMIEGMHYNWVKDVNYHIDATSAWRNFYKQCLIGDTTDNIPGLPGVGPVGAGKLLDGVDDVEKMRSIVEQAYKEKWEGDWEVALQEIGKLLWIRRKRI